MSRFVAVPAVALAATLAKAGFASKVVGKETVYERANHNCSSFVIRVYSSAKDGATDARGCGLDAIRVCLLWADPTGKTYGVAKATRVYRTGTVEAVIARMLERMRDLYGLANRLAAAPRCPGCGAPCYADSGKCIRYYEKRPGCTLRWVLKALPTPAKAVELAKLGVAKKTPECPECSTFCRRVGGKHECPDDLAAASFEERAYGRD